MPKKDAPDAGQNEQNAAAVAAATDVGPQEDGALQQAGRAISPYEDPVLRERLTREHALGAALQLRPGDAASALRAAKKFAAYLTDGTVPE